MKALDVLCGGGILNLEGIYLIQDEGRLEPGDLYIAERNQGPKLLTVQMVNWDYGYVIPTTNDYLYDIHECAKVKEFNRSI